ncbi:MAG: hypothetical protein P1U58_02335 [Verrucomicrobiales bacterium]|nr:hypothetical protein [Verrucomicrobiales bacterium]
MNTLEPVPPAPTDPVFQQEGKLFVTTGTSLPTNVCVCCGAPTFKIVNKALRNPFNPMTWFGGQPREELGFCKKHTENYQIALALTFSLLAVGLILLGIGLYMLSIGEIVVGLLLVLVCGIFRARVPVWSPNSNAEPMEIRGVGNCFLEQFPNH